jgi:hypothetical protein
LHLHHNQRYRKLNEDEKEKVEKAIGGLKERLIVEEWLTNVELQQYYERYPSFLLGVLRYWVRM